MSVFYANRSSFKLPDTGEGFDNSDNDPRGPWKADPFDTPKPTEEKDFLRGLSDLILQQKQKSFRFATNFNISAM